MPSPQKPPDEMANSDCAGCHAASRVALSAIIATGSSQMARRWKMCESFSLNSGSSFTNGSFKTAKAAPAASPAPPPSHARLEPPSSIIENTSRQTMIVAERWLCSTSSTAAGASIRMKGRMP